MEKGTHWTWRLKSFDSSGHQKSQSDTQRKIIGHGLFIYFFIIWSFLDIIFPIMRPKCDYFHTKPQSFPIHEYLSLVIENSYMYVKWRLALPICLCMNCIISHCICWPLTLPDRWSAWKSGMRHCVFWKTGRTGLQIVWYFWEILWAQFLHFLLSRETLKSFMVMSTPCD